MPEVEARAAHSERSEMKLRAMCLSTEQVQALEVAAAAAAMVDGQVSDGQAAKSPKVVPLTPSLTPSHKGSMRSK